jgi:hypothetical protein
MATFLDLDGLRRRLPYAAEAWEEQLPGVQGTVFAVEVLGADRTLALANTPFGAMSLYEFVDGSWGLADRRDVPEAVYINMQQQAINNAMVLLFWRGPILPPVRG